MAKKQLSFEEAFKRLQDVVQRLEGGNLTLDESLTLFEEGTRLARLCNQYLDEAELRITKLRQTPAGDYVEEELQVTSEPSSLPEADTELPF